MAKSPKKTGADGEGQSQPSIVVALAIVTLIAGGAGAGFAFAFLKAPPPATAAAKPAAPVEHAKAAEAPHPASNRFPPDAVEVAMEPIITGLGPTADRKMRLEASIIVTKEAVSSPTLKTELAEDIVVYLNGVTAEDISGVRGLQNLREDLDDRARVRGRGMVLGLLISGFVLE